MISDIHTTTIALLHDCMPTSLKLVSLAETMELTLPRKTEGRGRADEMQIHGAGRRTKKQRDLIAA